MYEKKYDDPRLVSIPLRVIRPMPDTNTNQYTDCHTRLNPSQGDSADARIEGNGKEVSYRNVSIPLRVIRPMPEQKSLKHQLKMTCLNPSQGDSADARQK